MVKTLVNERRKTKAASKREKSKARFDSSEREQARPKVKNEKRIFNFQGCD